MEPMSDPLAATPHEKDWQWRIDDLARRSETPVDTIRYYQREHLLPAGERRGRVNFYGAVHLDRLQLIKDWQDRRFSLAAIKALLTEERSGLMEGIFGGAGERTYDLDELIAESGISIELEQRIREVGFFREPSDFGRDSYDGEDLEVLRTLSALYDLGVPQVAIVEIVRLYAKGIEATQQSVVDLFATGGDLDWNPKDLDAFQSLAAEKSNEILPLARQLVDYTHHRTIQRLTLGAITLGTDS